AGGADERVVAGVVRDPPAAEAVRSEVGARRQVAGALVVAEVERRELVRTVRPGHPAEHVAPRLRDVRLVRRVGIARVFRAACPHREGGETEDDRGKGTEQLHRKPAFFEGTGDAGTKATRGPSSLSQNITISPRIAARARAARPPLSPLHDTCRAPFP